ncbi:class I SAM-dependent methyltransferase [Spirosoma soli]|uniref:Class I SAM-dependent methyltransferase n=1 Tax=Spirosoma soli TaxID=1770529 RepID=A0ABW5MBV4_9BACT
METVIQCPVCGKDLFRPYMTCKDYLVSSQEFTIQQCESCSFRFTNPRPDPSSIGSYYKSDQYISHNDSGSGLINVAYRAVRNYTLRSKLNLINRLNGNAGSLLDVGCGTGAFLQICKSGGWQVMGMEPDDDARRISADKLQIVIKQRLSDFSDTNKFDVITLWHVLEHIADLNEAVSKLHELLDSRGTLLIAVPNSDSYDAQFFKQYWAAYDVPRHLHHFTPSTIQQLFQKHNLKLIDKRPMVFDAFYIAMLSTQYISGETDYLKSVRVGLTSNNYAKQTGHYSSLIYIFKQC